MSSLENGAEYGTSHDITVLLNLSPFHVPTTCALVFADLQGTLNYCYSSIDTWMTTFNLYTLGKWVWHGPSFSSSHFVFCRYCKEIWTLRLYCSTWRWATQTILCMTLVTWLSPTQPKGWIFTIPMFQLKKSSSLPRKRTRLESGLCWQVCLVSWNGLCVDPCYF